MKVVSPFLEEITLKNQLVYKSEYCFVFVPERPVVKGHLLIVTKRHIESILDLNDSEKIDVFNTLSKMEEALKQSYKVEGFNILTNQGKCAGQRVFHLHFHLVPRWNNENKKPLELLEPLQVSPSEITNMVGYIRDNINKNKNKD